MSPRVVIVAPEDLPVPPIRGGSVQIYLHALISALAAFPGVQVTLLAPAPRTAQAQGGRHQKQPNRSVRELPSPNAAGDGQSVSHPAILQVPGEKSRYLPSVIARLRDLNPDWIQIDNRPAWVPILRRHFPQARLLLNLHSLTFLGPRHLSPAQVRRALRLADAVVFNSHYLYRAVARRFRPGRGKWRPYVIRPGVDWARFHPPRGHTTDPAAQHLPQGRDDSPALRLVYVGRVIRGKGVHILLRAVRRLTQRGIPVTLTIIGRTPPWEQAYASSIRRMMRGLPVRWLGFVPPTEVPAYLWTADVLVCPSQQSEAFGLVNVEAMAAGLAVIASRQGGIREVVDDSCGVLVSRYRDPESFARAIAKLARDRGELRRLQQGALQRAARFTWQQTARGFVSIYQQDGAPAAPRA